MRNLGYLLICITFSYTSVYAAFPGDNTDDITITVPTVNTQDSTNTDATITITTGNIQNNLGYKIDNNLDGVITNNNRLYNQNSSTINNNDGGIINNLGTIYHQSYSIINNYTGGIINNSDTFYAYAPLNNNGGIINNSGAGNIISGGLIYNQNGAIINNSGDKLYSVNLLYNQDSSVINNFNGSTLLIHSNKLYNQDNAVIHNTGLFHVRGGADLFNQGNAVINIKAGGELRLDSRAYNQENAVINNNNGGIINNNSRLSNQENAVLNNYYGGIINNNYRLYNQENAVINNAGGRINSFNSDRLYNEGYAVINNTEGGIIKSTGYSYIYNRGNAVINNTDGVIDMLESPNLKNLGNAVINNSMSGIINNENLIYNRDNAVINNIGGIINSDDVFNYDNAVINNTGGVINNDIIHGYGNTVVNNTGIININLQHYLRDNSVINNTGGIINHYPGTTISTDPNSTINIDGGELNFLTGTSLSLSGYLNLSDGQISLGQILELEINDKVSITGGTLSLDPSAQLSVKDRTMPLTLINPIVSSGSGGNPTTGGLTLEATNTATVTLTGENTFTGETIVNGGTLIVNGSLITPVTVDGANATFGGKNTVLKVDPSIAESGNLTVTQGTLLPGGNNLYSQLTVEDKLALTSDSTVKYFNVSSISPNFINVADTAALDGALEVSSASGNFLKGAVIPILNADGGRNGVFSSDLLPLSPGGLPLFEVQYTPNSVNLIVLNNSLFNGQTVGPGNPTAVADNIIANASQAPGIAPNSELGFAISVLGFLSDDELNKALNFMHPAAYGTLPWINMNNNAHAMNIFSRRQTKRGLTGSNSSQLASNSLTDISKKPLVAGTLSGATFRDNNVLQNRRCKKNNAWVQPYGNLNYQGRLDELRAVNSKTIGAALGYDRSFCNSYLGLGGGYTYTDFTWKGNAGDGRVNQAYGAFYGNYWLSCFTFDFCTLVGGNFYDVNRRIEFEAAGVPLAVVGEVANGDYTGIQWSSHVGAIGDFRSCRFPFQLLGNVDYFLLYQESFSESGAGNLGLDVDSNLSNMLRSELGGRALQTFYYCGACYGCYIGASWVSKIPIGSTSLSSTFEGLAVPFTVNTTTVWINQVVPSVGFEVGFKNGLSFGFDTYAELNGDIQTYYFDLNFEYAF